MEFHLDLTLANSDCQVGDKHFYLLNHFASPIDDNSKGNINGVTLCLLVAYSKM